MRASTSWACAIFAGKNAEAACVMKHFGWAEYGQAELTHDMLSSSRTTEGRAIPHRKCSASLHLVLNSCSTHSASRSKRTLVFHCGLAPQQYRIMCVRARANTSMATRSSFRWLARSPGGEDLPVHGADLDAFWTPSLYTHTRAVRRAHVFHRVVLVRARRVSWGVARNPVN
jgi:hypothetical protein